MPKIKVCYDNLTVQKGVSSGWGFSALVTFRGRNILFDTGGKPDLLLANLKAMRISPEAVTDVFISHIHWDHTGGLFGFLSKNHKVKVYVPASFSQTYQKEISSTGAKCIAVKDLTAIGEGLYSSGELGTAIKEQALLIDTPKGLIIMTGCAHPGILKFVREARNSLKRPVFLVMGGFHLEAKGVPEINKLISDFKKLGVQKVAPCHCTGQKAVSLFAREYKGDFIKIGAGSIIDTDEL